MPVGNDGFKKGSLFIVFDVEFPNQLSAQQQEVLKSVLGMPTMLHSRTHGFLCTPGRRKRAIWKQRSGVPEAGGRCEGERVMGREM